MEVKGNEQYISPEINGGNYSKECDIWSLGVTMYVLLTNEFPYKNGKFDYPFELSDECVELIHKMIQVDQKNRITAFEALHHPWIAKTSQTSTYTLDENIILSL
jgi:serine/threonine protein kinase